MNKTYVTLSVILILFGFGLVFLESRSLTSETQPEILLKEYTESTRYISTDEIAERIINGDPAVQLIDVRSPYDFMDFALPGAVNIPFEDFLLEGSMEIMNQDGKDFIFYSNGDVFSNQAWMMAKRMGYTRIYVLDDGLNKWIETIIQPLPPSPTEPQEAIDLYRSRLGASQYFTGGSLNIDTDMPKDEIIFTKKKKKAAVEGGC